MFHLMIFAYFGLLTADFSTISTLYYDLSSNTNGGGAIFIDDSSKTFYIGFCDFVNCSTDGNDGGAISINALIGDITNICGQDCWTRTAGMSGQFLYMITKGNLTNSLNQTTLSRCGHGDGIKSIYFYSNDIDMFGSLSINLFNITQSQNKNSNIMYESSVLYSENAPTNCSYAIINKNEGSGLYAFSAVVECYFSLINMINNSVQWGFNYDNTAIHMDKCCYFVNKYGSMKPVLGKAIMAYYDTYISVTDSFFDFDVSKESKVTFTDSVITKKITMNALLIRENCSIIPPFTSLFSPSDDFTIKLSPTNTFSPSQILRYRAVVDKKGESYEIKVTAGVTAGVSVILIVVGIILMIIYLRIKTARRKHNSFEFEKETSDTHTSDYSYSYYYSYYYSEYSVSYNSEDGHHNADKSHDHSIYIEESLDNVLDDEKSIHIICSSETSN